MEFLNLKKSKFLFFFFPKTIAGDIGRVILGSFIFLTILVSVGFVLILLAMIFYGTTPRAGLFIMLVYHKLMSLNLTAQSWVLLAMM